MSRDVVIVGGGFAGAAAAYHLLRRAGPETRIHVVERSGSLGRGVAYAFKDPAFRLNVPASRMSLDPASPDDFVSFARTSPNAFAARGLYGDYVEARLKDAIAESQARVELYRDEAVAFDPRARVVHTQRGRALCADALILATGLTRREASPAMVDAWDERALEGLPRAGRLLLIGSSLSALDVLALLSARGFEGHVTMLSRHGLLPRTAGSGPRPGIEARAFVPSVALEEIPEQLGPLVRWVRARVAASGADWRAEIDGLRPHVARIYRALSPRDQARFVRHVRPYWDVVRHRAPPEALELVSDWESRGSLSRVRGQLRALHVEREGITATLSGVDGVRSVPFDAAVRCTGPSLDARVTPLEASLMRAGLLTPSPNGLGFASDAQGRMRAQRSRRDVAIWGIGAVLRASSWESTSVPEIASRARALARAILAPARRDEHVSGGALG